MVVLKSIDMFRMQYVLITPARNEEDALPNLAECIANQTIKPKAWVIIDDCSNDGTPEIAKSLSRNIPWIYYLRLNKNFLHRASTKDFELNFSTTVKVGFEHAISFCKKNNIDFDYIGKIDADMLFPNNYFERLMENFELMPQLGVAGGYAGNGNPIQTNVVYGGSYLLRRQCFEQIGDIPIIYDIDNIIQIKAIIRNWKARTIPEIRYIITRPSTIQNIERQGFKAYVLNYGILIISWFFVRMLFMRNPHHIPAFICGYLTALVKRERKVDDPEVKYYYQIIYLRMLKLSIIKWMRNRIFGFIDHLNRDTNK